MNTDGAEQAALRARRWPSWGVLVAAVLVLVMRPADACHASTPFIEPMHHGRLHGAEEAIEEAIFDNCFLAGTLVVAGHQRSDGQVERVLREVQEVKPDDLVLAQDPVTGEVGYRRVVRTFENVTTSVVSVTVGAPECLPLRQAGRTERHAVGQAGGEEGSEDGEPPSAGQPIRCTPGHPWRVRDAEGALRWVFAGDLRVGDLLVPEAGPEQVVLALDVRAEAARTFNFEVEGWHTYYVAGPQGQPGVLVHNQSKAILKSIRRHAERLVKGKVDLANVSARTRARVQRIQQSLAQNNRALAGTHFHSLNAQFARQAQRGGHLQDVVVNRRFYTGAGKYRIPDYRMTSSNTIFDIKPWRPTPGAYHGTQQFQDLIQAGMNPMPLYYRLW